MHPARPFRIRRPAPLLAAVLVVAGCGGGSGGGGSGGSVFSNDGGDSWPAINANVGQAAMQAPKALSAGDPPADASTYQSSHSQDSPSFSAEINSDHTAQDITIGNARVDEFGGGRGWSVTFSGLEHEPDENGVVEYRDLRATAAESQDDSGGGTAAATIGTVNADAFTRRLNPGDTDYLLGGVWLLMPSGGNPNEVDFEAGAFAHGTSPTPDDYLTDADAIATYSGSAIGAYSKNDMGERTIGRFTADVTLRATFGGYTGSAATHPDASHINGEVTGFDAVDDSGVAISDDDTDFPATLALSDAPFTDFSNPGFFNGATSGADAASNQFTGKWGGRFYGGEAQAAAGTFGAATSDRGDDYSLSLIGAFGAEKE